jgi:type I restriction enzyme S subunit
MSEISVEKKPNFQFRNLTFIKSRAEELNQIENTVLMESVFDEYKQLVKLGSVLSKTQYGFTASSKDVGNSKLLRITDLNEGSINWDSVPFCDCSEVEKYKINDGDILIARTGGTTGKTVLIDKIDVDSVFASYLIRLSVGKEYNPEYVYIFLNSYLFWNQIFEMKNGTAQPNVNAEKMKELKIPYCPLDVQNEIVFYKNKKNLSTSLLHQANKKFNRLKAQYLIHQSLISENVSQSKIFTQLRQAILQEAIEGKLTADWRVKNPVQKGNPDHDAQALLETIKAKKQKFIADGKIKKEKPLAPINPDDVPFALPDGWVWVRLGEIASIVRGGSPRPAGDKTYYDGHIPFLKVGDLTRDNEIFLNSHTHSIKEAGLYKTRFVEANTLMLTNSGATLGVPKICTFPTTFNDGIAAFLGIEDLNKVFFYYLLKLKTKWFLNEAARGQGQPNLNTEIIGNTVFALPPLSEQNAIVERVDRFLNQVNQLEIQFAECKDYAQQFMQSVLAEAFTS